MPADDEMPENEDVRKKALLRLAVAGVVTAAALGGLWWLDQSSSEQKKPPAAVAPAPIVPAPQAEAPAPETEVAATAPEDAEPATETTAQPDQAVPAPGKKVMEAPPPPRVDNNLTRPARAPSALLPSQTPPIPRRVAEAMPLMQAASAPGQGFVVQLGVFSNPDNARELVEKLKKQGIRAHLEARVQLGPFLNRKEAERAQSEMRKLGYNALVTLPYLESR